MMDSRPSLTSKQTAYSRLREMILVGEIVPAAKVSEPELSVLLGVGRSPVREALLRLEQEGFVVRGSSGRVSVAPLEITELQQLYVVRANLEGLATRLAAARLRTIDLEEMATTLEAMRSFIANGEFRKAIEAGRAFHSVIHRECENQPLIDALVHLESKIDRFRYFAASFDSYDIKRVEEHGRILDALYRRDPPTAEAEMIFHINQSADALMDNIRRTRADQHSHRTQELTPKDNS
jgi:DNA-binding GntR family transcriptional regulator